jgi:transcriptional regulator with XRE-family HTH domain
MQAAGFDWHHNTVLRTESGARPVRLSEAVAIASVLRVPLDYLLRAQEAEDKRILREELAVLEEKFQYAIDQAQLRRDELVAASLRTDSAARAAKLAQAEYEKATRDRAYWEAQRHRVMEALSDMSAAEES